MKGKKENEWRFVKLWNDSAYFKHKVNKKRPGNKCWPNMADERIAFMACIREIRGLNTDRRPCIVTGFHCFS
jgi:hypothetical protein